AWRRRSGPASCLPGKARTALPDPGHLTRSGRRWLRASPSPPRRFCLSWCGRSRLLLFGRRIKKSPLDVRLFVGSSIRKQRARGGGARRTDDRANLALMQPHPDAVSDTNRGSAPQSPLGTFPVSHGIAASENGERGEQIELLGVRSEPFAAALQAAVHTFFQK